MNGSSGRTRSVTAALPTASPEVHSRKPLRTVFQLLGTQLFFPFRSERATYDYRTPTSRTRVLVMTYTQHHPIQTFLEQLRRRTTCQDQLGAAHDPAAIVHSDGRVTAAYSAAAKSRIKPEP
jgi:hypothetical protein